MADNFDWIKDAVEDFGPLHKRNDTDRDLYNQLEYRLKDLKTKKVSEDVVNITMNDPKVFADRSQAFMNEATMQTVAEGKHLSDRDTTFIEDFDSDIRYEIDQSLMVREISSLYSFLVEQSVIRGTLAARYVTWQDKEKKFQPDLLPCDSRYLVYEYGRKDLSQAAFRTTRSAAAIEDEYPLAKGKVDGKKGAIWEYWNKEKGEIWLSPPNVVAATEGQKLDEKPNIFGYVPFIIQGVGAGSMLQDEDSMEHRYESIFANNRLLYEHLNMLGSILQTLNYMTFNRVHLWESESGTGVTKPPKPGTRKTLAIDKGTRGLFPMEVADINNGTRLFYALILGAIQRGALPNIDYGNLTFPLSAVAISRLTATKDAIFRPRLEAIAWFYRKLHYMIRDQYVKGGYEAELGGEGLSRVYKASDLDLKYKISYKFHSVSPEQDIANHAVAQQAFANKMSQITIYTEILKLKDPLGEIMRGRAERAEQIDPVIGLFRFGHALIEEGNEQSFMESDLIGDKIEQLLRQRYAPALPGAEEEQIIRGNGDRSKSPKSLIPILEGGRQGQGAPASEEEIVPPEETLQKEERRSEVVRKNQAEG